MSCFYLIFWAWIVQRKLWLVRIFLSEKQISLCRKARKFGSNAEVAFFDQVGVVQSSFSVGSSIELLGTDTYESEGSGGNTAVMGKSASGVCCSCSKKSLCKTTKCECRAAGGSCGTCCGCAALKCTNRKVSIKADDSQQSEVAQKLHVSSSSETGKDVIMSQSTDLNNDLQPLRKPLHEIGNARVCFTLTFNCYYFWANLFHLIFFQYW